jgi:hypothetical protein
MIGQIGLLLATGSNVSRRHFFLDESISAQSAA